MNELGNMIDAVLKTVHPEVYHDRADDDAVFPYVVYRFPVSTENYQREDFILEIDIWGTETSQPMVDVLTHTLDKTLHRLHHYEEDVLQVSMYRINRIALRDPDQTIQRRQLRYRCDTYFEN